MKALTIAECVSVTTVGPTVVTQGGEPLRIDSRTGGSACYVVLTRQDDLRIADPQDFEGMTVTIRGVSDRGEAVLCVQRMPANAILAELGDEIPVAQYEGAYWDAYKVTLDMPQEATAARTPPFMLALVATGRAPVAPLAPCGYTRFKTEQTDIVGAGAVRVLEADPMRRRALLQDISQMALLAGAPIPIFIGPRNVTLTTGYPLTSTGSATTSANQGVEIRHTDEVWAIHGQRLATMRVAALIERQ